MVTWGGGTVLGRGQEWPGLGWPGLSRQADWRGVSEGGWQDIGTPVCGKGRRAHGSGLEEGRVSWSPSGAHGDGAASHTPWAACQGWGLCS